MESRDNVDTRDPPIPAPRPSPRPPLPASRPPRRSTNSPHPKTRPPHPPTSPPRPPPRPHRPSRKKAPIPAQRTTQVDTNGTSASPERTSPTIDLSSATQSPLVQEELWGNKPELLWDSPSDFWDSEKDRRQNWNMNPTPLLHPLASFRRAPRSRSVPRKRQEIQSTWSNSFLSVPNSRVGYDDLNNSEESEHHIPDIIYGEDTWARNIEITNPYATHSRAATRHYPRLNLEMRDSSVTMATLCTSIADTIDSLTTGTIELFPERDSGADDSISDFIQIAQRDNEDNVNDSNNYITDQTDPSDKSPGHDRHLKRWRVKKDRTNKEVDSEKSDSNDTENEIQPHDSGADGDDVDDNDVEVNETFFYCRWITEYPVLSFALTFSGQVLIVMLTISLILFNYDLFPTEFEVLPMSDLKVPWLKRDLAWAHRNEFGQEVGARYVRKWYLQGVNKWFRSMAYGRANIVLYYDTGDGNIFDKTKLQRIQQIENSITSLPEYENFCVQTSFLKCEKPMSVLRFFDGTLTMLDPVFNDPNFDNVSAVLHAARTNKFTKAEFPFFLSKGSVMGPEKSKGPVTRTIIPIGYPLLPGQKQELMEQEMKEFLVKHFKPVIESLRRSTTEFKLVYWSYILFRHDIVKQIGKDAMFAMGSVLFILVFVVYHTKSLWVSMLGVFSIITSFLCANMIYRVVLDFRYFGFFHVIAFFIILGIGADDLFVFIDVWKATAYRRYPSLAHRLSDAYRKSMLSMLFTSITTTTAFFASAVSPLLAPMSFGVFAGVLVIVNFLSVIFYFPTVIVIHHLYFQHRQWPCVSWIRKIAPDANKSDNHDVSGSPQVIWSNDMLDDNTAVGTTGNAYNVIGLDNAGFIADVMNEEYGFIRKSNKNGNGASIVSPIKDSDMQLDSVPVRDAGQRKTKPKQRKILVRFFRDHYFRFITHWAIRWIIVIMLLAVVVFFSFCASKMETENEQAKFYRSSHNYGRALELDLHGFVASKQDRNVVVYIVWGLKERDMSVCHFSDAKCKGTQKYDPSFNPNTPSAQLALKAFCDRLYNFTSEEIEKFKISLDVITKQPEIKCFTKPLEHFLDSESITTEQNMSLPWDYTKTINVMQELDDIYSTNRMDTTFDNEFEIPISYWLNNGYRFENKTDFNIYHSLIGESITKYSTPVKSDMSVFYGNRIVYIGVQVNLTLGRFSTGYPVGKPTLDAWESFVQNQMQQMPPGLQNGFQVTKSFWHSVSVQKTMADDAIFGVIAGILLAFPILIIATQNIIIGFFATLCMCCSTICVIGFIPLAGWKLGIIESLNMCMVVGLSVDYVVHLAEGYHMSKRTDRKSRVQDMLEIMGISVFSGACTTLGASLFMFFAQILFIIRFGLFMFCTIGFSLVFSLGLFTTLMGILGPSGSTGDISAMCKYIKSKLRRNG